MHTVWSVARCQSSRVLHSGRVSEQHSAAQWQGVSAAEEQCTGTGCQSSGTMHNGNLSRQQSSALKEMCKQRPPIGLWFGHWCCELRLSSRRAGLEGAVAVNVAQAYYTVAGGWVPVYWS
jgi:hypothetical protein